jgi:formate/nitrite transporter FocA (FNT family)
MEEQMKKIILIVLLVIIALFLSESQAFAEKPAPNKFLTVSCFINPVGIGYKHAVANDFYLAGSLDYRSTASDLEFQTGALYLIPKKILIFRFYVGGGLQFSRNQGYQYPYVSVGTNFLFLFTEMIHPLEANRDPRYRFGFSVKF